ncbi:hypothetical protein C8Q80DRAFT_1217510 [Daedaleopsis nitida]|nr:hypothetical protein C8Q80DRAFT_1217510 [Daedaleopsis nitida]
MVSELESLLAEEGIEFDHEDNRLRCFPHVINICVKHGLKSLTKAEPPTSEDMPTTEAQLPALSVEDDPCLVPVNPDAAAETNTDLQSDPVYADALMHDPVKLTRQLINSCRASGLRRTELNRIILEGNDTQRFSNPLRPVRLLRDVDTRWSSTYLMIDRFLELYPALQILLSRPHNANLKHHLLTNAELDVLSDIRRFLWVPYCAQEILAGEHYPTACMVLPLYEHLLTHLKIVREKLPRIAHAIDASIAALEKYMHESRKTIRRLPLMLISYRN